MKRYIVVLLLVIFLPTVFCHAAIDSLNVLTINFTDQNDTKSKAIWSEPSFINVTPQGLGWDGQENACRDFWLQTTELAIGLSWRPASVANITVELEPLLKPVTLKNSQTYTPSPGSMFVRYSPDAKHWSSWQMMRFNDQMKSKYLYTTPIGIPQKDRAEYIDYMRRYQNLDVPWTSDEEAMVKWIVEQDPHFFEKPPPFIGYVQVLYNACIPAGQRLARLEVTAQWAVGGMHSPPKNESLHKDRMNTNTPWRYRVDNR